MVLEVVRLDEIEDVYNKPTNTNKLISHLSFQKLVYNDIHFPTFLFLNASTCTRTLVFRFFVYCLACGL